MYDAHPFQAVGDYSLYHVDTDGDEPGDDKDKGAWLGEKT